MADNADLLAQLVANNTQLNQKMAEQQQTITVLLQQIKNPAPLQVQYVPAAPNDADVRAEKVQKINLNIRKSNRLKLFKVSNDSDIKLFLKKFDEELQNMKVMVGLDENLTRDEYVPIFRSCLDYPVVERVGQVLTSKGKTWENVTIDDLVVYMKDEFGSKQTDVANVLKQFGPQRLAKRPDESVAEHYFRWLQNIPEVMKPTNDQGYKDFVDLVHRSMYYISLEDEFLQKALSDLKDPNPDLKKYFDEAVNAESRLKAFQDITKSSTSVEDKGVTISYVSNKKKGAKSDKSNKGAKQKDVSTGDNAKFGDKQKQNSDKQKPKQNSKSPDQNNSKKKWCSHHKQNSTHVTKDCLVLQNLKRELIK